MNLYELRLYDETLMTFSLEKKGLEGLVVDIKDKKDESSHLFPLTLDVSNEGLKKWLEKRVIPKNRAFVQEILKTLSLSPNDTKGIIDVCKGLSLNDSYWVVEKGFEGKFDDYNLYENQFSEALSLVAYTGIGSSNRPFTTSPELTTNGMMRKAWKKEDGKIYLYKGGTEGAINAGNEPYSEYYACQVGKTMGLNCVSYDLEKWKGILASKCELFTSKDVSYVPIGRIVKEGGLKTCLDFYKQINEKAYDEVCSMLTFDAIIYNEDRHFGNFGVLRDNKTGEIISPAPIFDNGMSLFNYGMKEDIDNLEEYSKTRTTPYGVSFDELAKEVIGKTQKEQLKHLYNFSFERHPQYNLPEERLMKIEQFIRSRARELMKLVKEKDVELEEDKPIFFTDTSEFFEEDIVDKVNKAVEKALNTPSDLDEVEDNISTITPSDSLDEPD